MEILGKLQNLSKTKKKIILWSTVIALGLILFIWWVKNVQEKLKSFPKEEFREQLQLPSLEEELRALPKIEMPEIEIPEISDEELKQLEETMKGIEQRREVR